MPSTKLFYGPHFKNIILTFKVGVTVVEMLMYQPGTDWRAGENVLVRT